MSIFELISKRLLILTSCFIIREHWNWNTGTLEHWNTGTLAHTRGTQLHLLLPYKTIKPDRIS